MVKSYTNKRDVVLVLAVSVPVLVLFLVLSFYVHPIGDDFWCTAMVRKYGYWEAQSRLYGIAPPRWLAMAISSLSPLSFGNLWGYKLIPVVFLLLFVIAMAGLFQTTGKRPFKEALLPALLFAALYFTVLPGIAEGIYWASSLYVYQVGILLFIVWCTHLLKWYYNGKKGLSAVVVCLSLAGMFGCSELIGAIALAILGVIFFERIAGKRKGVDGLLLAQLAVVVVAVYIGFTLAFRGAMNRYGLVSASGSLLHSLGGALLTDGYYVGRILINPFFWALALPGYGVVRDRVAGSPVVAELFRYRLHFFVLWVFIMLAIPFCMVFFRGEVPPPLRISNMVVFFFLLGLFGLAGGSRDLVGAWVSRGVVLPGRMLAPAVILLVVAGCILPNNVSHGAGDLLSGRASAYDKSWNRRVELIRQCKGDSCVIPHLGPIPYVFSFEPDTDEPHISEYFEKEIIVR